MKLELEQFKSYGVLEQVDIIPPNAEIMCNMWLIMKKVDNLNKTDSTIKAQQCFMGNSLKDSVQFESPTCSRESLKAIFSLDLNNEREVRDGLLVSQGRPLPTKGRSLELVQ